MQQEIAVTGYGAVTSLGLNAEDTWNALLDGKSGVSEITGFDTDEYPVHFGGEISSFDPDDYFSSRKARRLDRFVQYGLVAAEEAAERAGLLNSNINEERVGVVVGSGIGGLTTLEEQMERLLDRGPSRVSPFFIPKLMMNAVPGHISMEYNFKGPNFSTASACASGNHAITSAANLIRLGKADIVITGGVEAALTPSGLAGFCSLKALSKRNEEPKKASRPFDKDRDGFVLGEGAGILVLESKESAKERNASIHASYLGGGTTSDAHHITAPEPEGKGASRAIDLALQDAGCNPEEVSYINAHGTSTPKNDPMETQAIHRSLKPHSDSIPVSSTKSMIGHSLGASAGIEALACVLSIKDQTVHPTINYETPDPECDLDYVPNSAREMDVNVALSNSFGFGGHSSCIAFGK